MLKFGYHEKEDTPMKRIKAACLEQTVHFLLKDELPREAAEKAVRQEYVHYLEQMNRNRTQYQVLEELPQADGSLIVKLKKQYNSYDCTPYIET